jgi:hypothetical protein
VLGERPESQHGVGFLDAVDSAEPLGDQFRNFGNPILLDIDKNSVSIDFVYSINRH